MTEAEFDLAMERGDLDQDYARFIERNWIIGNGDMLLRHMESDHCYQGFRGEYLGGTKK